jgi:hypothetical protein
MVTCDYLGIEAHFGPISIFKSMAAVAKEGTWGLMSDTPVRGILLWIVWVVEAGIILGIAAIYPYERVRKRPYCEQTRMWMKQKEEIFPLEIISNPEAFKSSLDQGDFSKLKALKPAPPNSMSFTQLELRNSPVLFLATIKHLDIKIDKKGKEEKKENIIAEYLVVTSEDYEALRRMQPAPPDIPMPGQGMPGEMPPPPPPAGGGQPMAPPESPRQFPDKPK